MNNPKLTNQIAGGGPGDPAGPTPSLTPFNSIYPTHDFEFTYQDNVDGTHPHNIDYFMPVNLQRMITARLSFKFRAYRTYSNFSLTSTGVASVDHTHTVTVGGESGHTHSHNHGSHAHSIHIAFNGGVASMNIGGGAVGSNDAAAPVDFNNINGTTPGTDSTGSSGHNHGTPTSSGMSAQHTHTVSGSSFLGITEGAVATGVTIAFDGVDQTAALGGPFNTDQVELDVTKFISTKVDKLWHLVALQPSGLGRIQAILRILYSSNPV